MFSGVLPAYIYGRKDKKTMQKTILVYGLISGTILAFFVFFIYWLYDQGIMTMDKGEIVGYTSMVIALTMVFFGIKSYRDNYGKGSIKFWKAVQIGLLISIIASVMYGGAATLHSVMFPEWGQKHLGEWADLQVKEMKEKGAPPEQIEAKEKEMKDMLEMIKNPFILFALVVVIEILPVGIIITLISAAILRKREVLPAPAT